MESRSLLRRTLTLTPSTLTKSHRSLSSLPHSPITRSQILSPSSTPISPQNLKTQISGFRSTLPSRFDLQNLPLTLFEGCDFNHWLIIMKFPEDPKPTPEEMVNAFVQTLAEVVGSEEEAKKRMYAFCTTTYCGFQAVMTQEMSKEFKGLPGVRAVVPDSYIDPVNKEYGGDKYICGTIIPRPPPIQYLRQRNLGSYPSGQGDGSGVGTQPNYGGQIPVGNRDYVPPENRDFSGNNRNTYPPAGDFSQGAGSNYGQSYPGDGEGQRYESN